MNPYLKLMNRMTGRIMRIKVPDIKFDPDAYGYGSFINQDNDWVYPTLGCMAHILAWAWTCEQSEYYREDKVWRQMMLILDRIVDNCQHGKWWREKPRTGDANINRFALLPLMETFIRIGLKLDQERKKKCLKVMEDAVEVNVKTYHGVGVAGEYPNMDAYFMVIMELAAKIFNRGDYRNMAWQYAGYLESCLLPDGGFTYFKGTNECECYHNINVLMLVRYWELTNSRKVLEILEKTMPYYSNIIEPSGAVDYYTDPHFKHDGKDGGYTAPSAMDILATLFPNAPESGEHRFLANVIWENGNMMRKPDAVLFTNATSLLLAGLNYWRDEPGQRPRDRFVRYDGSIRGPRGRFGSFSWAATSGNFMDTFVGAIEAENIRNIVRFQAAGVDLEMKKPRTSDPQSTLYGRRTAKSFYLSGRDYFNRVIVGDNFSAFAVRSPLVCGDAPWIETAAESGWQTRQVWWMGSQRMVGLVIAEPSCHTAEITKASIYFRLGGTSREVVSEKGIFLCGRLALRIVDHNFDDLRLNPAYEFYLHEKPTSTEIALSSKIEKKNKNPLYALVELFPAGFQRSAIKRLGNLKIPGFVLTQAGKKTAVAVNDTNHSEQINEFAGSRTGFWRRIEAYCSVAKKERIRKSTEIFPGELIVG